MAIVLVMSREFLKTFSPENQRSFEALTIPRLQRMVPDQDCAPQALLQASGVSSLSEFVRRRYSADPIDLGSIDDDGRPDPLRMRLQGLVKDFFLGESVYLERHSGQEHRSRRPPQHLDVRLIGSCKLSSTGEGIRLFCCRYGETVDGLKESSDSAWRYRDVQLHPRDVHLAIINFIMTRDEFGFLLLQPTCFTRRSLGVLPWYDELPVLK